MKIDRDNKEKIVDFGHLAPGKVYETQDPRRHAGETMFVLAVLDTVSAKMLLVDLETGRTIGKSVDDSFTECGDALLLPYGQPETDEDDDS